MRRLLVLCAIAAAGVVALPAHAQSTPEPRVDTLDVTAPDAPAPPGYTKNLAVPDADVSLVGLRWDGDRDARFRIETVSGDGQIDPGQVTGIEDNGADTGTAEDLGAQARRGAQNVSEGVWVDDPAQVRIRVLDGAVSDVDLVTVTTPSEQTDVAATAAGMMPRVLLIVSLLGLGIALLNPKSRRRLTTLSGLLIIMLAAGALVSATAPPVGAASQPGMVSRAGWGADEGLRLRNCPEGPSYAKRVDLMVIHHTVGGPGGAAEVRGIYAYHTIGRGYCDIAYNFLIGADGTIYEGRYGGIARTVIGAHATNFNTGSSGIALMGNYTSTTPSGAMQNQLVALLQWKMSVHNINPYAATTRYGVVIDPIISHRDAGAISGDGTSCPGNGAYGLLGWIRALVRPGVFYGSPYGAVDEVSRPSPNEVKVAGWAFDPDTTAPIDIHAYVGGPAGVGAGTNLGPANNKRNDFAAEWPGYGPYHGYSAKLRIRGTDNRVCLYAINKGPGGNILIRCRRYRITPRGNLDSAVQEVGGTRLRGWALDFDALGPVKVQIYRNGKWIISEEAFRNRDQVGVDYPAYGPKHGFNILAPGSGGRVCAYARNLGRGGARTLLGCKNL